MAVLIKKIEKEIVEIEISGTEYRCDNVSLKVYGPDHVAIRTMNGRPLSEVDLEALDEILKARKITP